MWEFKSKGKGQKYSLQYRPSISRNCKVQAEYGKSGLNVGGMLFASWVFLMKRG